MCKQLWEPALATVVRDGDSRYCYRRSEVAMFSRTMPQALNHRRHGADDAPTHEPPATMIPAVASIPVSISVSVAIPISTWRRTIDDRWRLIDNLRRRLVIDRRRSLIHGSGYAEINPYACVRRSSTGRTRSRNGYDEQRYFAFHDSLPGWTASPIQRFVLWQGNGSRRGRLHVQPMPLFCNGQ